jgi:galactonate dehydratase
MQRKLELLESRVSPRTRWHFLVLTDEGGRAVGECSDSSDVLALSRWLDRWVPVLAGRDLDSEREEVLTTVRDQVTRAASSQRFVAATAAGGLEQLLLDSAARRAGVPLWKWLDCASPDPVPVYANINRMPGGREPADLGQMATAAVAAGFTAVKCAPFDVAQPGRSLSAVGLDRVRAVRRAVGDEITVQVDCHERLPVEEIHALLPQLEELGVAWLEDAAAISQVETLAELKAATVIPLAGGERMFDPAEARPAVAQGVIDVLMPDVKHAGGVEQVVRIAQSVPELAVSPHNPSGPVATAASAQLFAACPNTTVLEYAFGETPWRSELVGGHELLADGHLHLDDRPGLGVELDPAHPSIRVLWSALV